MPPRRKEDPTLSQVIDEHIDAFAKNLFVAMPGEITAYDFSQNLANVQPLLKRKYVDEESAVNLPELTNVFIAHPRMGKSYVRLPVKVGDKGMLLFADRSLDIWKEKGVAVDPLDTRMHALPDAVFYPGPDSKANPMKTPAGKNSLTVVNDKMMVELMPGGKIKIKSLTTGAELVDLLDQLITSLLGEAFIFNKGAMTAISVLLKTLKG